MAICRTHTVLPFPLLISTKLIATNLTQDASYKTVRLGLKIDKEFLLIHLPNPTICALAAQSMSANTRLDIVVVCGGRSTSKCLTFPGHKKEGHRASQRDTSRSDEAVLQAHRVEPRSEGIGDRKPNNIANDNNRSD